MIYLTEHAFSFDRKQGGADLLILSLDVYSLYS